MACKYTNEILCNDKVKCKDCACTKAVKGYAYNLAEQLKEHYFDFGGSSLEVPLQDIVDKLLEVDNEKTL